MTNVTDGDAFTRVPPQDLEAEQASAGAMLLSSMGVSDVRSILTATDFYRPAHAKIFTAACGLADQGEPVDPITLAAELERLGELHRIGGAAYLHTLVQMVPSSANGEYYAERVRECAVRRHAIEAHARAIQELYDGQGDLAALCDSHEAALHAAHRDARTRTPYLRLNKVIEMTLDDQEQEGTRRGVLTGFTDVDALTHGFQPGEFIVIAARPAMGKSTLATDFLRTVAIQQNIPTALFSLEMGTLEIGQRVLSAEARVGLHHIRGYSLTEDDYSRIARRMPDLLAAPMFIDTSPNLTMAEIATRAREMHSREGLALIAVDYLQLLESGTRRGGNRQEEVSEISRRLKLLAKELDVPVIALSQLNRGPESREDKRPVVSDLRESGSIEQDADMVILLHRPDAYDSESPRAGEADLIFGKCRNAPTCTVTVAFQGHYSRFIDMGSGYGSDSDYRNTLPRRETPVKAPLTPVRTLQGTGTPPVPLSGPHTAAQPLARAIPAPTLPADDQETAAATPAPDAPQDAPAAPEAPAPAPAPDTAPQAPRAPFAVLDTDGHLIYPDGHRTPDPVTDLTAVRHLGHLAEISATRRIRDLYVPAATAAALGLPEDIGMTEWNEAAPHPAADDATADGWDVQPAGLHKRLNVYRADTRGHGGALVFPAWDPNIDHGQEADAATVARALACIHDQIGVQYAASPTATMRRLVALTERDKVRTEALQPIRIPDIERAYPELHAPHLSAGIDLTGKWLHMFDVNKAFASSATIDLATADYVHHTAPELPKYLLPGDYRVRADLTRLATPQGQRPTLGRAHIAKGSRTTVEAWVRGPLVTELRERGAVFEVTEAWIAPEKRRILADPMKRITDAIDALKAASRAKGDAAGIAAGILKGAYAAWVNGDIQSDYHGERDTESDRWYRPDISADAKANMLFRKGRLLLKASQIQPLHVIADETDAVILLSDNPDPMEAVPGLEIDPVKNGKFKHVASAPVTDAIEQILKDPKARGSLRARKTKEAVKAYGKGE